MSENPYAPPEAQSTPSPVPLLYSIAGVFGSAILGGLIGMGIGAALGTFAPDYYRSTFFRGDPNFNPFAVGVGQGLTQGLIGGALIGIALVALFYRYRLRVDQRQMDGQAERPGS